MSGVALILGGKEVDRLIENADGFLARYRSDIGFDYLDHRPVTPPDVLLPEDLAVTLLVNSRAGWRAFKSLQLHAAKVDLGALPDKTLEQSTLEERCNIRDLIVFMASWPGFGASLATKVLHKKRPALIPILDNQAIFGAYLNRQWPERPASTETVKDGAQILLALNCIACDLTREENRLAWDALLTIEPRRTRIQLLDSIWWMYFRYMQPVEKPAGRATRVGPAKP